MKTKIAIAVSSALAGVAMISVAAPLSLPKPQLSAGLSGLTQSLKGNVSGQSDGINKFIDEPNLAAGEYVYIVRLKDDPVASYQGTVAGLPATKLQLSSFQGSSKAKLPKIDTSSAEVKSYVKYLNSQRSSALMAAAAAGIHLQPKQSFQYAFNGFSAKMTQEQAKALSQLASVAFVEREKLETLQTDTSPAFIGATAVWDGSATGTAAMGEGVIVGVLDTGINSDHPSFASTGADGYSHTNPWGQGVYVGDCAGDFSSMCNDKLIGVRSYADITDDYDDTSVFGTTPPAKNGEDYNGHGSHTASTAAGNILKNVPYVQGETGVSASDGIDTGLSFTQVSGIAPHANIVAYQICRPGETGDTYAGCPSSAILKALDDAVADGVDVINYSISGGGNPWTSATEQSFFAARNAGIFAAVAAGNTSSTVSQVPYSSPKNAPWYTSVAASTHTRGISTVMAFNGKSIQYTASSGPALTADIIANVVYAGAVSADGLGCSAFSDGAFTDKLALISRGSCSFAVKVANAADAGAKGVIVFNNVAGDNSRTIMSGLADSTIPSVFINTADGQSMVSALAVESSLQASLNAAPSITEVPGDVLANFSLLGPNAYIDIVSPSIAAPGVDIYAAYSDEQYGHDATGTDPADYTLMSGTSMATPHVAGAGALLKSAHPNWTPDNIRSALMLTATTAAAMTKADGETTAEPFDVGAGRIRVDLAAKSGLIMDETVAHYEAANPAIGGDAKTLNLPSMADASCVTSCSWTRTVTATGAGTWSVSAEATTDNLKISVSPASLTLAAGQSATVTVTADVSALQDSSSWAFGNLVMTSDSYPIAHMPIAVKSARDNLPSIFNISAGRNKDSITFSDLKSLDLTGLDVNVTALAKADVVTTSVAQDSDVSDFLDDPADGVIYEAYEVAAGSKLFNSTIRSTTSPDLDMYVVADFDGDGRLDSIVGYSAAAGSHESVTIKNPRAGIYYVFVQNYEASSATAMDSVVLNTTVVGADSSDNFVVEKSGDNSDFSLKFNWDDSFAVGDSGYAVVALSTTSETAADRELPIYFERAADDVVMPESALVSGKFEPGTAITLPISIAANTTDVARVYSVSAAFPASQEIGNVSDNGVVSGGTVTWSVTQESGAASKELSFDLVPRKAGDYSATISNTVENGVAETISQSYSFSVAEVAPVLVVTAPTEVEEGKAFTLDAADSTDANGDDLTFQWTQLSGTPLSFSAGSASLNLTAPEVDKAGEILSFMVTVTDTQGNAATKTIAVNIVEDHNTNGGALGWFTLLLLPLTWLRRRR